MTILLYEALYFSLKLNSIFPENRVKRNIKTQYAKDPLKDNTSLYLITKLLLHCTLIHHSRIDSHLPPNSSNTGGDGEGQTETEEVNGWQVPAVLTGWQTAMG